MDIYDRIEQLINDKKISAYRLSKDTGISTGLLSQWKKRLQNPSIEKLQIIADYFNVSIDYLTGNEQKEKPSLVRKTESDVTFDDFTYALHDETKELTDENKKKLLEMARFFKQQQDKEQNK